MCIRLLLITTLLGLVGCAAKPLEVDNITSIVPKNGTTETDVYAAQRAQGVPVPEYGGDQLVEIRTYSIVEQKGKVEMSGAQCRVSAGAYTATTTTPAKVRVPLYRNQSESLAVKCEKPGYESKLITLQAYDKTRSDRFDNMTAAGSSGGLIGVVASAAIAGVVDASSDNSSNIWRCPAAKITLEKMK